MVMPVSEEPRAGTAHAGYCPGCGHYAGESRFCTECGQAVGDPAASTGAAARPVGIPSLPAGGSGHRRVAVLCALGGSFGLAAIGAAAVILLSSSGGGAKAASPASADAVYRQKLTSALAPLISANQTLSGALAGLDGSGHSIRVAKNATSSAQSALAGVKGAVAVLTVPTADAALSQQVQQALTDENGYLQAVSSTLTTPSGNSAATLQPLATSTDSALVPLNAVAPGAQSSIGGTSNLISWSNGAAAGAARAHDAAQTHAVEHAAQQVSTGGGSSTSSSSGSSGSSGAWSSSTNCGGGLTAGPNTSCPFAENVRQAYDEAPGAVATVMAYSPVTNETYSMSCAPAGSGVTCSGANNASVSW